MRWKSTGWPTSGSNGSRRCSTWEAAEACSLAQEQTAEAIVIFRSDAGESDRRLTLLTPEFGRIDVVAKGARKGGSRLAGSSEPLVHGIFHYAQGRAQRYITQTQPISSFPAIRSDYDLLVTALAFCELLRLSIPYESPAPEAFEDLVSLLKSLQAGAEPGPALCWAAARLMAHDGRAPDWTTCQDTGERVSERPAWVSASAGGHVSRESAREYGDAFSVEPETLIALNKLLPLNEPPHKMKGWQECLKVLHHFWRHELHSSLPGLTSARESLTASPLQ